MESLLNIEEIRVKYYNGDYKIHTNVQEIIPEKLSKYYVFDENLSVKQNKEMIREHNEKVDAMKKANLANLAKSILNVRSDVVSYIAHEYCMSKDQARVIELYAYSTNHSFMNEYFDSIDDIAQMVEDVLNVER